MENVKTNNKPYIAVIVALALVIVGLGIALYFNSQSMSGHANNLESVYQKSLYRSYCLHIWKKIHSEYANILL